jgi:hypothetical protein
MFSPITDWIIRKDRYHFLRIPTREEFEGILLLGDPGTGKTQILHQLIGQVWLRTPEEAGVCFDPACEFLAAHYDPETDIVLNPLDARFPYWSPSLEVESEIDRQLVAESFFPYEEGVTGPSRFFTDSARDIFELMLARKPTAARIVEWLSDEKAIDGLVAGTEVSHKISKKAGPQRVAVLSTLAKVGKLLKMLPPHEEGQPTWSLTQWARKRRGWVFITSTQETREALRPLQAAWLNILMRRLLSAPREWGKEHPCWVMVDEVHALGHLSVLPTFIVESRKYGIKPVFGTQSRFQFERHYGKEALTMLAAPHLKIYLRCNESVAAQWVAENIGEEERERPRVGTTANVHPKGRDSVNYSTVVERRAVVSKEQIMSLPNFHGYWKYEDRVVAFRIGLRAWPKVAEDFVPRQLKVEALATTQPVLPQAAASTSQLPAQSSTAASTSMMQPRPEEETPVAAPRNDPLNRARREVHSELPNEGINLNF